MLSPIKMYYSTVLVTELIADNEAKNAGLVVYVHDACAAFELAWEFGSEIVL
ncbi:hypothetical protein [Algoriphagus persicinus]|uniref:hypothetical protein n=1 Tax=Algoriphagus persicinus TaxID=3108754 RepID=UPI002B3C8D5C|nr:hypothetical protein [Algoriphagus sp. E1-3-M2]MEB2783413.1 hypothetical protein [Algoriphagus sp. E1-3-M2]